MVHLIREFNTEWESSEGREKAYMIGGGISIALAIVGIFLPIVPQVPFAILAAILFSKGSPRIHKRIRENKHFGRPVRDWEDDRVVRPKLKAFSTVAMIAGAVMSHFKVEMPWVLIIDALFLAAIIFVVTRKSKPERNEGK